ncbi:hypothetical protein TNCT_470541 [Trichonephila clavata]|uniref:Uncharacterized protein n=1 Tax=Trichonephila clavata TaxID=2740835 RepID=A0A8X6IUA6_TRICU|nr:hypothetical protein TNCT_470541 [Trichonephila clavata]
MSESPNIKLIEDLCAPGRKVAEDAEEVTEPNIQIGRHSKEQNELKELIYVRCLHQKTIQKVWKMQQENKDKISRLQMAHEKITSLLQESSARIAEMAQGHAETVWCQQQQAEPEIHLQQDQEESIRWLKRELAQSTQRLQEELEQSKERLKQEPEISLQRFKLEIEDTIKKLQSAFNRIKKKNQQRNEGRAQIEMKIDIARLQRMNSEIILRSKQEAEKEAMLQQGQAAPAIRFQRG